MADPEPSCDLSMFPLCPPSPPQSHQTYIYKLKSNSLDPDQTSKTKQPHKIPMEKEVPAGILEITELRLGLPGERECVLEEKKGKKRAFCEDEDGKDGEDGEDDDELGRVKDRVVGWPPICSYRQKTKSSCRNGVRYVKVSMDGAPFLRKIDLNMYRGYSDLSLAYRKLFQCLRIGDISEKDSDFSEYKPIYEDRDGDWMLVGDVPWEMFTESCRRLRIMKSSHSKEVDLEA